MSERFGGFENPRDDEEREKQERRERTAAAWERFHSSGGRMEKLEALEEIATEALRGAKNELGAEIALKFLAKIGIKKRTKELEDHWDDDTYQTLKGLGLFIVNHRRMEHDIADPDGDVDLRAGDEVLDLHLPPPPEEDRKALVRRANQSFREIAAYVKRHGLKPKYVAGITYEALADLAPRFGFKTKDIPLLEELVEPVESVYAASERGKKDIPIGRIELVYQTLEDFMRRWEEPDDFHNIDTADDAMTGENPERLKRLKAFLRENNVDEERIEASIRARRARREVQARMKEDLRQRERMNPEPTEEERNLGTYIENIEPHARQAVLEMRRKGYNTASSGFSEFDFQTVFFSGNEDFQTIGEDARKRLESLGAEVRKAGISFRWDGKDLDAAERTWNAIAEALPDRGAPAPPASTGGAGSFRKKHSK